MSGPANPATCPGCGAPIWVARTRDGTRIPLETFTDMGTPGRYTVIEDVPGGPHIIEAVAPQSMAQAYPDHRQECPDYSDGN